MRIVTTPVSNPGGSGEQPLQADRQQHGGGNEQKGQRRLRRHQDRSHRGSRRGRRFRDRFGVPRCRAAGDASSHGMPPTPIDRGQRPPRRARPARGRSRPISARRGNATPWHGLERREDHARDDHGAECARRRAAARLGECRPRQPPRAGAKRGPHRHLARPRDGAGEQQVGEVDAGNQQHERDEAGNQEQAPAARRRRCLRAAAAAKTCGRDCVSG